VALDDLLKKHGRLTLSATLYVILKIAEEVQALAAHGRHSGSIPASRVRLHGRKIELAKGRFPSNAPELKAGEAGDALSDVWEVGSLLYRMLAGVRPKGDFVAPSAINPAVDTSLDELVMSAVSKDPGARPYSMEALIKGLHGIFQELDLEPSPSELTAFVGNSTAVAIVPPPAPKTEVQLPPSRHRAPPRGLKNTWVGEEEDDEFEPSVVRSIPRQDKSDKVWAGAIAVFALVMLVIAV
jgi:serine/threonine protein kinase